MTNRALDVYRDSAHYRPANGATITVDYAGRRYTFTDVVSLHRDSDDPNDGVIAMAGHHPADGVVVLELHDGRPPPSNVVDLDDARTNRGRQ